MKKILLGEKSFSSKAIRKLTNYGEIIEYKSKKHFMKRLPEADIIITALDIKLNKHLLSKAHKLKLIGSRTTQLRYIDLVECEKRKIKVINIKSNSAVLKKTPSTAEETMGLIFCVIRKFPSAFDSIKREKWQRMEHCGTELHGKRIGIIGFGRLGKMVAHYCNAFSTKVIAYDPNVDTLKMSKYRVEKVDLDYLLRSSDIISVHAIYDESTYRFLNEEHFRKMKKDAYFINTSRGEITDEDALLSALEKKCIAGAAIDTLAEESPDGRHLKNNKLIEYARNNDNLIIVPHLGGTTREAIEKTQVYITNLVIKEVKKL